MRHAVAVTANLAGMAAALRAPARDRTNRMQSAAGPSMLKRCLRPFPAITG